MFRGSCLIWCSLVFTVSVLLSISLTVYQSFSQWGFLTGKTPLKIGLLNHGHCQCSPAKSSGRLLSGICALYVCHGTYGSSWSQLQRTLFTLYDGCVPFRRWTIRSKMVFIFLLWLHSCDWNLDGHSFICSVYQDVYVHVQKSWQVSVTWSQDITSLFHSTFLSAFVDTVLAAVMTLLIVPSAVFVTRGFSTWCSAVSERFPSCEIATIMKISGEPEINPTGFFIIMGTAQVMMNVLVLTDCSNPFILSSESGHRLWRGSCCWCLLPENYLCTMNGRIWL